MGKADARLMKDILAQMHDLTEEVKLLREQLGEKNIPEIRRPKSPKQQIKILQAKYP